MQRLVAMQPLVEKATQYREVINEVLKDNDRASLIFKTVGATVTACYIYDWLYHHEKAPDRRVREYFFQLVRKLPIVGDKIAAEVAKAKQGVQTSKDLYHPNYLMELPAKSSSVDEMTSMIESYLTLDKVDWKSGRVQGAVYDYDEEIIEITTKAYNMFMWSNPLHADVFRGVRKMEAEVIAMVLRFYNAPTKACGLFTSGGTESIGLACLAARNNAFANGIKWPEVVMPVTAHPAFDKACSYFRLKLIKIPVDPTTYKVQIHKMKSAISRRTCLIVGSAPSYAHGSYDDLGEINKMALKYGIPFHVDACLGGFLNPFAADAGFAIPLFDFRLEGVTSISCDTHKYGYCPKGSSTIMFRCPLMRRHAIFSSTDWPGGVYATPTYSGSRAGANVAVCWSTMLKIGYNGYVERTKAVLSTAQEIKRGIEKIDGLHIMGNPVGSVIAFTSDQINIFQLLGDLSKEKKWILGPIQFPSGIHMSVTHTHARNGVAQQMIKDIEEITIKLQAKGSKYCSESAAMYGLCQTIPDRSVISELSTAYIEYCLDTNEQHPEVPEERSQG